MTLKYKGHKINVENYSEFMLDDEDADYEHVLKILHPDLEWFYTQEDNYQGEWFAIGKGDQWYFSQGSFGSCSGCDWYLSIYTEEEALDYLKKMDIIIPIGNDEDAIKYLENEIVNSSYGREELSCLINIIKTKPYLIK